MFARGTVKTTAGFVVAELSGALVDVPTTLAGEPDGDFRHLGLEFWRGANPTTRCAFIQGRSAAYPRCVVYQFIYSAVRLLFEVPAAVASVQRVQRADLQSIVSRGYVRWLDVARCTGPIERFFERVCEVHQTFVVHSAAWRDMKRVLFFGEVSMVLDSAAAPGGFTLEHQPFATTRRDTMLVAMLLFLIPGLVLSAEYSALRSEFQWLDQGHEPMSARLMALLRR